MIQYEGKRITLKANIERDVAMYHRNNPEVFRWCRQYTLISDSDQDEWEQKISKDQTIKMFSVYLPANDCQVGVCGFTSINKQNQSAEFSLYIGNEFQGRGFGGEALYTLFRHGFEDMNFNRIWGEVFDGNPAIKKFIGIGMRVEGELRETYFKRGKFIDSKIVSILRSEWKS